jgi:tetratricopeptide (TPR) repeat protein
MVETDTSNVPEEEAPGSASDLSTLTSDDRGDGGSKDDKFDGDISILTKVLEQEPDNGRYMFYLAESYRHGKRYRSAIEWYRKGIDRGGWQEETWYARYMIGACHEALGELPEATVAYLDAHTDRPTRAEPLHDLARLWRVKGNPRLGYFLTKRASEVPTYEEMCSPSITRCTGLGRFLGRGDVSLNSHELSRRCSVSHNS